MIICCKYCGTNIKDREDKVRVTHVSTDIHIEGFCDKCFNWTLINKIPVNKMRSYISSKTGDNN